MPLPNPGMTFTPFDPLPASDLNDMVENIEALQDGSAFEANGIPASKVAGAGGYKDLAVVPTLQATNGQNSFDIQFPGVDYSSILSIGSRLKILRSGAQPTQSAYFPAGTPSANNASPTGIVFTTTCTLEAQINLPSIPASHAFIIGRSDGVNNYWFLRVNSDGKLAIYASNNTTPDALISLETVPLNKKIHVAGTITVGAGAPTGALYIDGAPIPFTVLNGTTTAIGQTGGTLAIGYRPGIGEYFNLGSISDGRVWSTARSQTQIRDNAYKTLVGNESGLVSYFPLNGNFNDITALANNLTAGGGAVATQAVSFFNTAYAIVTSTPVYSGGNTTMTVQTASGYTLPNQTLGACSYSYSKAPYGFPMDTNLWIIEKYIAAVAQANPVTNTIYNFFATLVPTGNWEISVAGSVYAADNSATLANNTVGLSNANNTFGDYTFTVYQTLSATGATATGLSAPFSKTKSVTMLGGDFRYINARTDAASNQFLNLNDILFRAKLELL